MQNLQNATSPAGSAGSPGAMVEARLDGARETQLGISVVVPVYNVPPCVAGGKDQRTRWEDPAG